MNKQTESVNDSPVQLRAVALGRSRFGGGRGTMHLLVLGSGLAFATAISTALCLLVEFSEGFWPAWINLTILFWIVGAIIAWFIFVDRQSLPTVAKSPGLTVEQSWSFRAKASAFKDLCAVFGIGCVGLSMLSLVADIQVSWPVALVCTGLIWFALIDYVIRYQLIKRAEG